MKRMTSDTGNVIVEFIGITVALLIPLSFISNSCIQVANAYRSTEASARTAARAFVVSSSDSKGYYAAKSVAGVGSDDFESQNSEITTTISCTKDPCLLPGGFVTVKVSKVVNLNLPSALGARSVVVTAQHTSVVDEMRLP